MGVLGERVSHPKDEQQKKTPQWPRRFLGVTANTQNM